MELLRVRSQRAQPGRAVGPLRSSSAEHSQCTLCLQVMDLMVTQSHKPDLTLGDQKKVIRDGDAHNSAECFACGVHMPQIKRLQK